MKNKRNELKFACSVILSCLIILCDWNFFMLSAREWNFSFLSILCKLAVTRYMVILQHSSCFFKILLYIGSSKWQYFLLLINYNHCRSKMGSYKVICYLLPKIFDDIFEQPPMYRCIVLQVQSIKTDRSLRVCVCIHVWNKTWTST